MQALDVPAPSSLVVVAVTVAVYESYPGVSGRGGDDRRSEVAAILEPAGGARRRTLVVAGVLARRDQRLHEQLERQRGRKGHVEPRIHRHRVLLEVREHVPPAEEQRIARVVVTAHELEA